MDEWRKDRQEWSLCGLTALDRGFAPAFQDKIQNSACNDQQAGDNLRLGGMKSKDGIPGIDPDLFYKKAFDTVSNQVESEESTGDLKFFSH